MEPYTFCFPFIFWNILSKPIFKIYWKFSYEFIFYKKIKNKENKLAKEKIKQYYKLNTLVFDNTIII